jgi:cyclopropane fatty-acyl-phospholipid synthase-like methyltransferase
MPDSLVKCICGSNSKWKFELRNFNFFRCQECQLLFVHPTYDAREIYDETYFKGGSHGFGFSNYESDKEASSGYLTKLLKWTLREVKTARPALLDVGAANGFFLTICKQEGIEAEGIEISQEAVDWAQKLGRNVYCSTIDNFESNQRYDVISALDVLEHIHKPNDFIKHIQSLLVENGIFLINVPYEGSITAKLSGKKWHALLPPEHWYYFNKHSLTKILESNGFEVLKMKVISKSFSLSYIYLTISNSPQVPLVIRKILSIFKPILRSPIGRVKIFLPLYDNLSLLARKVIVSS